METMGFPVRLLVEVRRCTCHSQTCTLTDYLAHGRVHASGFLYTEYVLYATSNKNLVEVKVKLKVGKSQQLVHSLPPFVIDVCKVMQWRTPICHVKGLLPTSFGHAQHADHLQHF
jgi:hypothetical protein